MTTEGQISTLAKSNVLAFLTKPYTAEKLLKALAAALTMNSSAIFLVSLTTPFI
jgi:FixJ family two-component response regulator